MKKKLLIQNKYSFHYEIIESVIVKYYEILEIDKDTPIDIHLGVNGDKSFRLYINQKYPNVIFNNLQEYDYSIDCTIYPGNGVKLDKTKSNNKYIAHKINSEYEENPNVYFLTPLSKSNYFYADILPYSENKTVSDIPIYIIQGNLNQGRRYNNLLMKILDNTYQYEFIIKLVGRGRLPAELKKYENKIVLKNNLDFANFHKEFLDAYCILPLISKKTHSDYYTSKLTSTINYARGYKLKCLIDKDLQEIYNLDNVEIYNDINDISESFKNTLEEFYNK